MKMKQHKLSKQITSRKSLNDLYHRFLTAENEMKQANAIKGGIEMLVGTTEEKKVKKYRHIRIRVSTPKKSSNACYVMSANIRKIVTLLGQKFESDNISRISMLPLPVVRPDNSIFDDPDKLISMAQTSFAKASRKAVAENDQLGIPTHGSIGKKLVVRTSPCNK
jgi:hypothetical protein